MRAGVPDDLRTARAATRWIDRWLEACRDLAELERSNPMTDAVIDEIDGRMIRIGDNWLADFASCNYLGFDLDREIIASVPEYLERWGTHPSWSRLLGSPVLYEQIEERLCELLGSEDALVLPTITLIHMSVIPVLAGGGTIFLENRAHKTIYEGCQLAAARGATVKRFGFEDVDDLKRLLREASTAPRLVCIDGVNSMTGNAADVAAFARVAREHRDHRHVDQRDRRQHERVLGAEQLGEPFLDLVVEHRAAEEARPARVRPPALEVLRDGRDDLAVEVEAQVVARGEIGQPRVSDADHPPVDLVDDRVGHRVRARQLGQITAGVEPPVDPVCSRRCGSSRTAVHRPRIGRGWPNL